jgi:hypothetical protein
MSIGFISLTVQKVVLLFALFMDSVNSLGYKFGSTDDTVIPVYCISQAGDLLAMLHSSTSFVQFFPWHFFCVFTGIEPQPQIFVCVCKLFSCFNQMHQEIFV